MRRLIEEAFPLKKVSEDSKHEKSAGRMGHISTLHIWPARRPLAASRAAVIAALLPDPGDAPPEVRSEYERLAGSSDPVRQREDLCSRIEKVTRWGGIDERELDILRGLIRKAYGGKAPKVLDIFAGGGAIPLEAMRLGCHAIAVEYNPVAWFILKCTLEFPSKLAGKTWPLPNKDDEGQSRELFARDAEAGDLAAHVRYWGEWVRKHVEEELTRFGIVHFGQVFAPRQQLALGVIAKWTRAAYEEVLAATGDAALAEAVLGYLDCVLARSADRNRSVCWWQTTAEKVGPTLTRFAVPMTWDFCEVPPSSSGSGGLLQAVEWVADAAEHFCGAAVGSSKIGFDLRSRRPDGQVRYIEGKGRARVGGIELTENEWAQAQNHPDRYWLYVVYDCETAPVLRRIKDPAGKGIGRPKGSVTIEAIEVLATDGEEN